MVFAKSVNPTKKKRTPSGWTTYKPKTSALLGPCHLDPHPHPSHTSLLAHLSAKNTIRKEVEGRCVNSSQPKLPQENASSQMGGSPDPSIVSTMYKKDTRKRQPASGSLSFSTFSLYLTISTTKHCGPTNDLRHLLDSYLPEHQRCFCLSDCLFLHDHIYKNLLSFDNAYCKGHKLVFIAVTFNFSYVRVIWRAC